MIFVRLQEKPQKEEVWMHACKGLRIEKSRVQGAPMTQDFLRTEASAGILQPSPHFSNEPIASVPPLELDWAVDRSQANVPPLELHIDKLHQKTCGARMGSRRCAAKKIMILLAWVPDGPRSLLDAKPSSAVRSSQHTLQCGQANMSFCCQTSVKTLSPSKTR